MKYLFVHGPAHLKWLDVTEPTTPSTVRISGADDWTYEYNAIRVVIHNKPATIYVDAREAPNFKLTSEIAKLIVAQRKPAPVVTRGIKQAA